MYERLGKRKNGIEKKMMELRGMGYENVNKKKDGKVSREEKNSNEN